MSTEPIRVTIRTATIGIHHCARSPNPPHAAAGRTKIAIARSIAEDGPGSADGAAAGNAADAWSAAGLGESLGTILLSYDRGGKGRQNRPRVGIRLRRGQIGGDRRGE